MLVWRCYGTTLSSIAHFKLESSLGFDIMSFGFVSFYITDDMNE